MSRMILAVSALLLASQLAVLAEPVPMTEKMTMEHYDMVYRPHYDQAQELDAAGKYVEAAHEFILAGETSSFAAHRAANYRNAAYMFLKQAQTGIGERRGLAYLQESENWYVKASTNLALADGIGGRDKSRVLTRKHINMGTAQIRRLRANPKMLSTARKDL